MLTRALIDAQPEVAERDRVIVVLPGPDRGDELEPARPDELDDPGHIRLRAAPLDPGDRGLRRAHPARELGLGEAGATPRLPNQRSTLHALQV